MSGACQPSSAESKNETESTAHSPGSQQQSASSSSLMKDENMSNVIIVNQQTFQSEVLASKIPVIVDFYATWCPPCRALSPILDRLAVEFDGRVKFVKVNSDEQPGLAAQYKVAALPTLVLVEGGKTIHHSAGLPGEDELRVYLNEQIATRKAAAR